MPKLVANKRMRYAGKEYKAGDIFDCDIPRDVKALTLVRYASLVPESAPTPKSTPTYRRRSMEPEPPAPPPPPPPEAPPEAPVEVMHTQPELTEPRSYRRRDMRPEE